MQHISHTHPGKRLSNQDALFINEQGIFIVCDGVGGSKNGQLAAGFVAQGLGNKLVPLVGNISLKQITNTLAQIEEELYPYLKHHNSLSSSTTLALAIVQGNKAIIAHCGDSKVVVYRQLKLLYETVSHNYPNFLASKGIITQQETDNHPQKNKLTRVVSTQAPAVLDVYELTLLPNDILLLYTDGVEEGLDIHKLLNKTDNTEEISHQIINQCTQFSEDNFTFILYEME